MSKIYTKQGDSGFSSINNNKLPKYSEYFHTLGYLDEVNSQIGWFLSLIEKTDNTYSQLIAIQNNLMTISSYLCGYIKDVSYLELDLTNLEAQIDIIDGKNTALTNFILPGGSEKSAILHCIRVKTRESERHLVKFCEDKNFEAVVLQYVNRLSDFFFVLARKYNNNGVDDVIWKVNAK
jgi:cob(I)alamin adenosyltransferase